MNILVTGGAGYIGSHTVRLLAAHGYRITIFDSFVTGHRELVPGFEIIEGDLGDSLALRKALTGIDVVMHSAASAYVGESVANPRKYFTNNVSNGLNLLHAVLDSQVRRFVLSSTCTVYGVPTTLPMTEEMPCFPANPYGESKLFLEKTLEAYERAYGLKSVRLRYFNAAGAHPAAAIGEVHNPETHLIPLVLEAAAGLISHLDVYGADYETPDGTCVRDFTHVMDLAQAHVTAVQYLNNCPGSTAINLGTGRGSSVGDVILAVERITGKKVRVRVAPRRPGDPAMLVADCRKAERVLNWRAQYSLDDMIETAWRWINTEAYQRLRHFERASTIPDIPRDIVRATSSS
jgi:UDP-glucose-4-epimerase GalE